jgi:HPt (histidine-containing phosphotransfer) domain-containing protein
VEGDQEAIDEIITACGEELPAALSTIQRAVEMEDAETLARTAHTIKGTAANVGALRLRKLAIETEAAGKSEDFKTAGRLLNQLDAAVTELMNALMQTDWTFLVRHDGKNRADESVDRRR